MRSLILFTTIILAVGCDSKMAVRPIVVELKLEESIPVTIVEPIEEPIEMAPQWMIDELLAELDESGKRLDRLSDGYAKLLEEATTKN